MQDDTAVEIAAIAGMSVLGIAALIVDGSAGEMIVVAISGALGIMAGHMWGTKGGAAIAQKEG